MKILCLGGLQSMDALQSAISTGQCEIEFRQNFVFARMDFAEQKNSYDWVLYQCAAAELAVAPTLQSQANRSTLQQSAGTLFSRLSKKDFEIFQYIAPVNQWSTKSKT